jgi:nitrogen fixation protein FixH
MASTDNTGREVKGWHVLMIFLAFFGVIIAVNVTLAWNAIATFPGLEVENSYVASQTFDVERSAQQDLGWSLTPFYNAGHGTLQLAFADATGHPVTVSDLTVLVGRTTERADDLTPAFVWRDGIYAASATLARGKWMMAVTAHAADGTLFHQRLDLVVER